MYVFLFCKWTEDNCMLYNLCVSVLTHWARWVSFLPPRLRRWRAAWRRRAVGRDVPLGEAAGEAAWASAGKDCGPFPGSYHSAEAGETKKKALNTEDKQETSTGRSHR